MYDKDYVCVPRHSAFLTEGILTNHCGTLLIIAEQITFYYYSTTNDFLCYGIYLNDRNAPYRKSKRIIA